MRVLIITNSKFGGGAEVVVNTLSMELTKLQGLDIQTFHLKDSDSVFWRFIAFFKMLYLILKFKPKVVQSHLFFPSFLSIFFSKFFSFKTQVVVHSISEINSTNLASRIAKYIYREADMIVCISSKMFDLAKALFQSPNVCLIHNPHDFQVYLSLSNETVQLPTSQYFIYVGRLTASKRVDQLIIAISEAKGEHKLIVVGDGEEKANLKELALKLGVDDRVYFLGRLSNPYPYIKSAKALLLASEFEGYPNCLIEALGLGVPVITSNCQTGPAEILGVSYNNDILRTTNQQCMIYPVGDSYSLIKAIESEAYLNAKASTLKNMVSQLSLKLIVKKYVSAIDSLY
ncbi:glycosyltransferase [Pseudoalteromonas ostreae]|uniref:glycosyltransferase n=1 Tax=Pseudoalteromonas ostreae TaxID=2774154 RepID=UPI001B3861BA|nr:glycosyltransferase [Pseudoalteromonas ostreae]